MYKIYTWIRLTRQRAMIQSKFYLESIFSLLVGRFGCILREKLGKLQADNVGTALHAAIPLTSVLRAQLLWAGMRVWSALKLSGIFSFTSNCPVLTLKFTDQNLTDKYILTALLTFTTETQYLAYQ